jgi:hypothetical protein
MQRSDRTPGESARAICLFLEAVSKVCHTRIAQMGNEARSVADGYQNRRIARTANFDVPQSVGVGLVRLDRVNIRTHDPVLSQHMCFAPQRRHFVFYVAQVQRPRGGKPGVNEPIGAMSRSAIRNTGQFHHFDSTRRGAGNLPAKPRRHCVPRVMSRDTCQLILVARLYRGLSLTPAGAVVSTGDGEMR